MEDHSKTFEVLFEKTTLYSKTGYELIKLKSIDTASNIVSFLLTHSVSFGIVGSCFVFANLGIAFWLGEIFGKTYFGFFVVAVFYALAGISFYLFLYKWIKKVIKDSIIKQVLK